MDVDVVGNNTVLKRTKSLVVEIIWASTGRQQRPADSARQLSWGTAPLILIELLLKHGADPYQKDSGGQDSFYWADKTAEVHILGLLKAWSKGGN